jgi:hypothetical protein
MDLTLELATRSERCEITGATATARPFNECGVAVDGRTSLWTSTFSALGGPNLADPRLERVHLHDAARREALVLLPYGYYFYRGVAADTPLKHALSGETDSPSFNYGYSSAASARWWTEHWLSPLAGASFSEPQDIDLSPFNRWATASELRDDLSALASRLFPPDDIGQVRQAFHGGDPPTGATLTLDEHADAIQARTLTLHFSRKPCPTCASGMTGWFLWKLDVKPRS